jgi:hypothetical protein
MAEHDDNTIAHMNMIQGVITRLETNCFTLKAMAMTMAAALLAFLGSIDNPNWIYPAAVCLPILVFWTMDAYYLRLGRLMWSSKNVHSVKRLLPKKNYFQKHLGFGTR